MASSKLAELYVQLTAKGAELVQGTLGRVHRSVTMLTAKINDFGRIASRAFLLAQTSLLGFIYAGTRGTTVGTQFSFAMHQLSMEIAAVFLPTLYKTLSGLQSLVNWFRSLSSEQQNQIQKWTLIGIGTLGVVTVLPKLIGLVSATVGGIVSATAATVGWAASLVGWTVAAAPMLIVIGGIAAGVAALSLLVADISGAFDGAAISTDNWASSLQKLTQWIKALQGAWSGSIAFDMLQQGGGATGGIGKRIAAGTGGLTGLLDPLKAKVRDVAGSLLDKMEGLLRPGTGQGHRTLELVGGKRESLAETFNAFQQSALQGDFKRPEQEQVDILKDLREGLNDVRRFLGIQKPIIAL